MFIITTGCPAEDSLEPGSGQGQIYQNARTKSFNAHGLKFSELETSVNSIEYTLHFLTLAEREGVAKVVIRRELWHFCDTGAGWRPAAQQGKWSRAAYWGGSVGSVWLRPANPSGPLGHEGPACRDAVLAATAGTPRDALTSELQARRGRVIVLSLTNPHPGAAESGLSAGAPCEFASTFAGTMTNVGSVELQIVVGHRPKAW